MTVILPTYIINVFVSKQQCLKFRFCKSQDSILKGFIIIKQDQWYHYKLFLWTPWCNLLATGFFQITVITSHNIYFYFICLFYFTGHAIGIYETSGSSLSHATSAICPIFKVYFDVFFTKPQCCFKDIFLTYHDNRLECDVQCSALQCIMF